MKIPAQTITVGPDYDNPLVTFTNADYSLCGVVMNREIDFSGKELVINELNITVRMNQEAAQNRVRVNGDALFSDEWELLRALANIPKDTIITGYADFYTVDGELFLTLDGEVFQVPVTQALDDFWEALLNRVSYATPVWYKVIDKSHEFSYKFFWKHYRRTGKYEFVITAQSVIGLLDRPSDGDTGGMFDGVTLRTRVESIMAGVSSHITYAVDPRLESVRVYGWQPMQSRRNALQDLIFTCGVIILPGENCDLYFTLPTDEIMPIGEGRVFLGGSVDKNVDKQYSRVDVDEHTFLQTANDREITLFDNTDGSGAASNLKVIFTQAPVYGLTASEGLTVAESNCNYAVVSGTGKLTGKPYTRVTQTVSVDGVQNPYYKNILSLKDVTLVNYLNSASVAKRIRDYYNVSATVKMDFIRQGENPGNLIRFTDPYGKERTGYLTALRSKVTSFDRASATVVCGYEPKYWGNTYDDVILLSGNGTWEAPETLDGQTVRIVLISGGNGGESGQHGTDDVLIDGQYVEISGCEAGAPGAGGKVYVTEISVSAGQVFAYQCGAGGTGGTASGAYDTDENGHYAYRNNPGETGGVTTFGTYSSDSGAVSAIGYHDIITRADYALTGPDNGVDGGEATSGKENGNRSDPAWTEIQRVVVECPWMGKDIFGNGAYWLSGAPGEGYAYAQSGEYAFQEWAYGGLGGGAAIGSNGEDGASVNRLFPDTGGKGGDGANALPLFPDDTRTYGAGGSGGHGGGEGGAGGSGNTTEEGASGIHGNRGAGGRGSRGQDGKEGCVLIYCHS